MENHGESSIRITRSGSSGVSGFEDQYAFRGNLIPSDERNLSLSSISGNPSVEANALGSAYRNSISGSPSDTEIVVPPSSAGPNTNPSSLSPTIRPVDVTEMPKNEAVQCSNVDSACHRFKMRTASSGLVLLAPTNLFPLVELLWNDLDSQVEA